MTASTDPTDMTARVTSQQIVDYGNTWALIHPNGEWWGEYSWMSGGTAEEPDWTPAEDGEFDPVEIVAVRFVQIDGYLPAVRFERQVRRRWFGLTEHEWETITHGLDTATGCVNCEAVQGESHHPIYCNAPDGVTS